MGERLKRLIEVLTKRNALEKWAEENMELWRVSTDDQPEAWFAPSGETFFNVDALADYLIQLPPGGSKAKFVQDALASDWTDLHVEVEDAKLQWNRAIILERLDELTCRVQFVKDRSISIIDISKVRVRWVMPEGQRLANIPRDQPQRVEFDANVVDQSQGKKLVIAGTRPSLKPKRRKQSGHVLFKEEVISLRRTRLKQVSEKGLTVLRDRHDEVAESIRRYLAAANTLLLDLEASLDETERLSERSVMTENALTGFSSSKYRTKSRDWEAYFSIFFSGLYAGDYNVTFIGKDGQCIEGLQGMLKTLQAYHCSLDETDSAWCFYRSLDAIEACDEELDRIAKVS